MLQMLIKPDLQTRESVMLAAGRVQFAVTTTEGVRYVKVEAKRKSAGGGYERGTVPLDDATHVFVSEKGFGTGRLGTYYPPKPGYTTGRFFEATTDATYLECLTQVVNLVNGTAVDGAFEIVAESRCGLCGIKLEDPVSIQRGIGPDCAKKPTGSRILHLSKFAATQSYGEQQVALVTEVARDAAEARDEAERALGVYGEGDESVPSPSPQQMQAKYGVPSLTELRDGNCCDMAEVECGVYVPTLTARQRAILMAALVEQEQLGRAAA